MQLRVFNGQGQFIRNLINGEVNKGQYQIRWDGTDGGGKEVEAGIYYLQLTDGKQRIGRRVVKL
jgi:flagellar hook assembly protein FlgD